MKKHWLHSKYYMSVALALSLAYTPVNAHALDIWPFDDGIDYELVIKGIDEEDIETLDLAALAREAVDADNPPETINALQSMSGLMAQRVEKAMRASAHYDASVRARVTHTSNEDDPVVTIHITPGQTYNIGESNIEWLDAPVFLENIEDTYLDEGTIATASAINDTLDPIKNVIDDDRCFLSLKVEPLLVLDRFSGVGDVVYRSQHGRAADFGETSFTGDITTEESILRKFIKWDQAECFTQDKVDRTQSALLQSQLVASATITYPDVPNEERQIPVTIDITERPHRTITAGTSFSTDEGAGITLGWEHRNLYGKAHRLNTNIGIAQQESSASAKYTIPYFYRDDQQFNITGSIAQETYDTFDSESISLLTTIDRSLTKELTVGVGGGIRFSSITEAGEDTEEFGLLYVPVYARWDSRDSSLDATKGVLARVGITPYSDVTGQGVSFLKLDGAAQTYLTASEWPLKPTLALRAAYGQINGASTNSVPADLRFYAGGGGSVRGYGFRAIGPQENGEANGGTIWTEFSTELRLRFTDAFGGVVFLDAGSVSEGDLPTLDKKLFLSTGAGIRYYSPIGPIRFDIGVPLDDIENDDTSFGVYVSIGQAF